jgi:hypothetical protein
MMIMVMIVTMLVSSDGSNSCSAIFNGDSSDFCWTAPISKTAHLFEGLSPIFLQFCLHHTIDFLCSRHFWLMIVHANHAERV